MSIASRDNFCIANILRARVPSDPQRNHPQAAPDYFCPKNKTHHRFHAQWYGLHQQKLLGLWKTTQLPQSAG